MAKLFANSRDPEQTPHSAVSDLGLHCLPIILLWVSRLQWINIILGEMANSPHPEQTAPIWDLHCLPFYQNSWCSKSEDNYHNIKSKLMQYKCT